MSLLSRRLPRRDALFGGLFGGLFFSLAPLFPRALSAAEPVPVVPDGRRDVVVVGSGVAGLCAAIAAREAGAERVTVLEKGPLLGGHSLYSSGSIAVVFPEGVGEFSDSPELFLEDAMRVGSEAGNPEVLLRIAEGSYAALRWLEGMGVVFGRPFVAHNGIRSRSVAMPGNSAGRSYVLALARRAARLGVEIRLNATVTKLRRPYYSGGAWDVLGRTRSGSDFQLSSGAVVLATGGFTANVQRRLKINPLLTADVMTTANPYGTVWDGASGDGLDLAEAVGGKILTGFGLQMLPFWGGRLLDYAGGDIYVDLSGRRFVDEAQTWNRVAEHILRLPERKFWVITDSRSYKGATLGLKLINGIVRKAESVREMASAMRVSAAVLDETLTAYNRAAREGFDPQTGKRVFTQTIETPPFYFGEEHIYVHTTLDGIASDVNANVLDRSGAPVEGLYAAGEVAGGIFGTDRLGGAGLTNCLVMGRRAGAEAARVARVAAAAKSSAAKPA